MFDKVKGFATREIAMKKLQVAATKLCERGQWIALNHSCIVALPNGRYAPLVIGSGGDFTYINALVFVPNICVSN